jgi:beta-lactamase regulating signal transducer with metallopeptidase domain
MPGPFDPEVMAEIYAGLIDMVLLKGTLLVLAAAIACYTLRKSSASIRHGVWAAAFFALLALPVMRLAAPQSDLTIVGVRSFSVATSIPQVRPTESAVPAVQERAEEPIPRSAAAPLVRGPITTIGMARSYRWIVAIWFAGFLLQLTRLGAHLRAVGRLRARAEPCPDHVRRRVRRVADELGLRRAPVTIVSPDLQIPSTFGIIRPTVGLPRTIDGWPSSQLEAALLHELAHLKRRDYVTHLIAGFVKAVYWVNPAVWYAERRLDMERERACDDGVVIERVDPVRYAEYLMSLALSGRQSAAQPVLSFANRSSLTERIRSLLDRAQARAPLGRTARLGIVAVAAVLLAGAGAIETFGVVQSTGQGVAALSDRDPIVRRYAAWAAGESENPTHVDELIEHLADPDARVRVVSAWALGEIKDRRAVAPLTVLLADEDARVREMAALAIGEIEDPSGLAALREAGPAVVSEDARAWAIAQIEHVDGYSEVFAGALTDPEIHVEVHARNLPLYLEQLADADPGVRARAAERLGLLGAPEAVDALLDALEDEDPAVRATAVWALDEINPSRARRASPASPHRTD